MADCYPWSAQRSDATGPTGVCLKQTDAITALTHALREIEPGIEGIVQAADLNMLDRDAGYVYAPEPVASAYRDVTTGAIVWTKTPDPEPAERP